MLLFQKTIHCTAGITVHVDEHVCQFLATILYQNEVDELKKRVNVFLRDNLLIRLM